MAMLYFDPGFSTTLFDGAICLNNTLGIPGYTLSYTVAGQGMGYGRFPNTYGYSIRGNNYDSNILYKGVPTTSGGFISASVNINTNWTDVIGGKTPLLTFLDSLSIQVSFVLDSVGRVNIYRGATLLATSSATVSLNAWHRVEVEAVINSSSGYAECRLDGVSIVTFSGNTQATANASFNQVGWGMNTQYYTQFCDLMAYTGTGAAPNAFLGDKRIYVQLPTANGSANAYTAVWDNFANSHAYALYETFQDTNSNIQRCTTAGTSASSGTPTWATSAGSTTASGGATFTCQGPASNFRAVNGTVPVDTSGTSLQSSTVGDEQGFTFPALVGLTGIVGVGVITRALKTDAGTRSIRHEYKSGASMVDNGSDIVLLTTPTYFQTFQSTDPATSTTWTAGGVNAAELRVKTAA